MINWIYDIRELSQEQNDNLNDYKNIILNQLEELTILKNEEIEMIFSEFFDTRVNEIIEEWEVHTRITKAKEYNAIAKTITHPKFSNKHKIIFDLKKIPIDFLNTYVYSQILTLKDEFYLPENLYTLDFKDISKYSNYFNLLLQRCLIQTFKWYKLLYLKLEFPKDEGSIIYLEEFKRNIYNVHQCYQKDTDLYKFLGKLFEVTCEFLERCIDCYFSKGDFSEYNEYEELVKNIISTVIKNSTLIVNDSNILNTEFILLLNQIYALCMIELVCIEDNDINIKIQNPKAIFKNDLLETRNYIIAFVDILGFSDMISEYDNDKYSNILKNLKGALTKSIDLTTKKLNSIYNENELVNWGNSTLTSDISNNLEYRMFSDCISFGLPYFDTDKDFITQFASIVILMRIFQHAMLTYGYMVRGGISFGSYYADDNMLFSGGLVKAYKLESKLSKMPRIIIDEHILTRIIGSNTLLVDILGLRKSLIIDKNIDNYSFTNPFNLNEEISIPLGDVVDNIEPLYESLKIDTTIYKPLIDILNVFDRILDYSSLPIKLESPFKNQIDEKPDIIKKYIEASISKYNHKLSYTSDEESKKEIRKIIEKYEWLKDLHECSYSIIDAKSDRFIYTF